MILPISRVRFDEIINYQHLIMNGADVSGHNGLGYYQMAKTNVLIEFCTK